MSAQENKKPRFDADDFAKKLAEFVKTSSPAIAARAYARAAMKYRTESLDPVNARDRLKLQALALRCDQLATEAQIPLVDPFTLEENQIFADNINPYPTEYDGLVHDVAASKIAPDGSPNTELMAAARLQQLQDARERDIAIPVQITPASVRPGIVLAGSEVLIQYGGNNPSISSSLAGQIGLVSGTPAAVQEGSLLRWEGRGEQEAIPLTLFAFPAVRGQGATYPSATNAASTNYSYRPFMRITWGTSRGAPFEAVVDVGRGIQVTLAAAYIYANAGMDVPRSTDVAGSMVVSGSLNYYSAARQAPAMRTIYIDDLANTSTSAQFNIPAFATGLLPIQVSEATTGACTIRWYDVAGRVLYRSQLLTPGAQVAPIPVANDAYSFDLTNDGSASANFRCMFQLSL